MILRIQIPESVYERLMNGEDVKAITNFKRDNKTRAYEIISEISGFDNFWFAMVAEDVSESELDWHCQMSSNENPVNLLIDVPETELFITSFYDFSDLIYFTAEEPDPDTVETIIKLFKSGVTHGMRQAIFPVIRPSYVLQKL